MFYFLKSSIPSVGTAYSSRAPKFIPVFHGLRVAQFLILYLVCCRLFLDFFCLFSFGHVLSDFRFPAFDNLVGIFILFLSSFLDLYITYENYLFMNNFLFRMMVEKQNEKLAKKEENLNTLSIPTSPEGIILNESLS